MIWFVILRAQSFTSLMVYLHQDLNRVSSSSRCLIEQILEGIVPLKDWYILPKWEYQQVKFFSSELTQQSLNRECLSSKCSTKAPATQRNSVFVLTLIWHQRRKWSIIKIFCSKISASARIPTWFNLNSYIFTYFNKSSILLLNILSNDCTLFFNENVALSKLPI